MKVNSTYSIWKDIFMAFHKVPFLDLCFSIYTYVICFISQNTDIASYADDNTLYSAQENRETVINTIKTSSQVHFNWFSYKFRKANSDKSHLLMSCTETTHANVDGSMIQSSQKEILLGTNLDSELKFEDHVKFMC